MTSIVIAGVGGQGTLLASRIIGGVAIRQGYDVKVSEVHGMSQRGGSVITYVRYGENGERVRSPIVDPGGADLVLAFELLEAYRNVFYLKPKGRMVANLQKIAPMPVITGTSVFPEDIPGKLQGFDIRLDTLDAQALAIGAGNARAANVAMIGRMAAVLDINKEIWTDALKETVKPAYLDLNIKAFNAGWNND